MEFIVEALSYPNISKIIYTSGRNDPTKSISDLRSLIAQQVNVIVVFADASTALLPTIKEATEAGITVVLHNGTYVGGEPGKDFLTTVSENLCELGSGMIKAVAEGNKDAVSIVELGGTPGNGLSAGWQKCSDDEMAANHPNMKLLGKADTNWTQEGAFQAMSGFLAQNDARRRRGLRIRRRVPRRSPRLAGSRQRAERRRRAPHRRAGTLLRLGEGQRSRLQDLLRLRP